MRDLGADLRSDSVELTNFLRAAERWDAAAVWVVEHEGRPINVDSASTRIRPLFDFVSFRPQRAAYTSPGDSGGLGLISDPGLRLAVVRYFDTHQVYAAQLHSRVERAVDDVRILGRRHTRAELSDSDRSMLDGESWRLRESWVAASSDHDFTGAIAQLGWMGATIATRLGTALEQNSAVQEAVTARLR